MLIPRIATIGTPSKILITLMICSCGYFSARAILQFGSIRYDERGETFVKQGRYAEAISELQIATKLNPQFSAAHYHLGVALYQTGQVTASIQEFQKAVRIASYFSSAYYYLGNALNDTGHRNEARDAWHRVLALPERPWAKAAQEQLDKYPDATR